MGSTVFGHRWPRKPLEQGSHSSNVLAYPCEVWERFIILNDPPVHVTGHGTCMPTVSMVLDLLLKLHAFLLELESCFLELLVLGLKLLHPQAGWSPYIPSTSSSRSFVGVASSSWMLLTCLSGYLP